jgi:hypothetical protein
MYLFVRRLLGRPAGMLAGLVYVYVPYRLFDLYVRAALAEAFSFVFIPLVLWGFVALTERPRLSVLIGTALAYTGLVLTSNAVGLLLITPTVGLLVLILLLLRLKDDAREAGGWGVGATLKRLIVRGIPPALGLALGLGLLAFFVLPLVLEYNYVRVDQWTGGRYAFGGDFVYLFQLFSPRWGFGASIPGPDDQAGFQLGLVPVVLFVFSFFALPRITDVYADRMRSSRRVLRFFQGLVLVVAFLMTPASEPIWRTIPLSSLAQFPWRLGVLTTTGLAVVAGAVVSGDWGIRGSGTQEIRKSGSGDKRPDSLSPDSRTPDCLISHNLSLVILVALVILGSYPYLRAEVRDPRPDEGPVSLAALFRYQQSSDEMTGSTAWTRRIPGWSVLAEQTVKGVDIDTRVNYTAIPPGEMLGVHSVTMDTVHELVWVYAADDQQSVTFFIPYYPGWTAYVYEDLGEPVDDLEARVGPLVASGPISTTQNEGWMVVPVPAGEHFLELRFEDTPVRIAGKWISLLALLGALVVVIVGRILRGSRGHQSEDYVN